MGSRNISTFTKDRIIQRLTERILQLKRTLYRDQVETIVEIGHLLIRGREHLKSAGIWKAWVKEHLHFGYDTARNIISLAKAAERNPKLITEYKHLGPSKLYVLSRLKREHLEKILSVEKYRTPSGEKTLEEMSFVEFMGVVSMVSPPREIPADLRVRGIALRIRGLVERAKNTLKTLDKADEEAKVLLKSELRRLKEIISKIEEFLG